MDNFDSELEQRVWKRVRNETPPPPHTSVLGLSAAEQNEAAVYLMLSRQMQGPEKNMLRKLFEQERAHAAVLRGMHTAITGQRAPIRTLPPEPQAPETALRACYARKLKTISEYENRTDDKGYGAVFSQLLQHEREHCAVLLQLLGSR